MTALSLDPPNELGIPSGGGLLPASVDSSGREF